MTNVSQTVSWNLQVSLREGRLDDARALMNDMMAATRDEEGAKHYNWYITDDGSTCHINESYVDSDAVLVHLGNFGASFAERFLGCFQPTQLSVYGSPSDQARAALDGLGAAYLGHWGGFDR